MPVIQIATLREGSIIDGARWEVERLENAREGQTLSVSLQTDDPQIMGYVAKQSKAECALDKSPGGSSVVIRCTIREIRHLIDAASGHAETMIVAVPANMYVEGVLTYMLHPSKCDPRWVQVIRGPSASQS